MRSDYYLKPFDEYVWLVSILLLLVGTTCILILHHQNRDKERALIDDLFLGFESFCNQCGNDVIENAYIRYICITLRFTASILIVGIYGANITSLFATDNPPFTNLEEFLNNSEYQLIRNREPPGAFRVNK